MSDTVTITLGPNGLRAQVGGNSATYSASCVAYLGREGDRAKLYFRHEFMAPLPIDDPRVADQIDAWILGDSATLAATASQAAKRDPRADDIGPGSIVDYLGITYVVSRAGDSSDGVVRWRLSGHTSRGVNQSALRLVTPIRVGDHAELDAIALGLVGDSDPPAGSGRILAVAKHDATGVVWRVDDIGDVHDEAIRHAVRTLDDGTLLVVR